MKDFNPISPMARDCIVCMDGPGGREDFYSIQEGNIAALLSKYKSVYAALKGQQAEKIAVYYINKIETTHLLGIPID
jgi:hypothetical protein